MDHTEIANSYLDRISELCKALNSHSTSDILHNTEKQKNPHLHRISMTNAGTEVYFS